MNNWTININIYLLLLVSLFSPAYCCIYTVFYCVGFLILLNYSPKNQFNSVHDSSLKMKSSLILISNAMDRHEKVHENIENVG